MFNHNFFVILQRQSVAKELFEKHLSSHASEAVNVDSHARQVTQVGLEAAAPDLFDVAQMQVSIASVSRDKRGAYFWAKICSIFLFHVTFHML